MSKSHIGRGKHLYM